MATDQDTLTQPMSLFPPAPARVDVSGSQTTRTKQGPSTETAAPGPEMLEATKARDNALEGTIGVADKKLRYDKDVVEINSERAAAELRQDERTSKAKGDIQTLYKPDLDVMAAEVKRAHGDYQKYESPKLFHNREGWENALLALGLAMGAFGGALKAKAAAKVGQVSNDDPVGDIIRMDLDRQRETIKHLGDKELNAKTGLKDRNDALAVELSKIDARGAEMYKRIAQVAQLRLQNLGVPAAEIERDGTVAKAREAAAAAQTAAAAGLTRRVTEHGETVSRQSEQRTTLNTPDPGKAPQLPTKITDQLSGTDLPVDPTRTDPRKHNTAVGTLPPINTFIDTAHELVGNYQEKGPGMPQAIAGVVGGGTDDASAKAAVTRLRSAYAAAKHESIGEGNAKHLESAIPDPPSSVSTPGQRANWLAKIHEVTAEMEQLRSEQLANAGVPPEHIARAKRANPHDRAAAPAAAAPAPYTTPPMVPGAAPPSAGPAPTVVRRGTRSDGTKVEQLSDGTIREAR